MHTQTIKYVVVSDCWYNKGNHIGSMKFVLMMQNSFKAFLFILSFLSNQVHSKHVYLIHIIKTPLVVKSAVSSTIATLSNWTHTCIYTGYSTYNLLHVCNAFQWNNKHVYMHGMMPRVCVVVSAMCTCPACEACYMRVTIYLLLVSVYTCWR